MSLQQRLGEATWTLMNGAFLRAAEAADEILTEAPGDPHATLLKGLAIASMGEAERAAPILLSVAAACRSAEHPCTEFARLVPVPPRTVVERQFRACLSLVPEDERLRAAFATFLLDEDRAVEAEAVAAHDRAVTLAPNDPILRVNRAVTHLHAGAWEQAWADYEARLDVPGASTVDKTRLLPSLQPSDDLRGLTIVATHEDGFGDTLHFCRYIPLLAARGARVVALVPPPLFRLMRRVPGVAEVISDGMTVSPYHYVCPMFSLPGVFRSTPETVPPVPAFTLDEELIQRWRYRLPQGKRLKVGIVWAGQARPAAPGFASLDRRRSAGLAAFTPLFDVPDVWFISLQAGVPADEIRPVNLTLFDPMTQVEDFADTAAIIANLDVVVSVDTSVVHLAGLMDKPVLMLDRYDNCWRWLHGRSNSVWYPKLTIFRQDRPNNWSSAMGRTAAALLAMSMARKTAGTVAPHATA